jgi:Icc-related predicted phosphoesterase
MRLHVISDVHGSVDALARAGDGADGLICLGDLILFLDYADTTQGIFAELFGPERTARFIDLRTRQRFEEAAAYRRALWTELGDEPWQRIEQVVQEQYAALFAAMPTPAYLTYGNVDVPRFYADYLRDGMRVLDGERTDIGGLSFGFVGGGLRTRYRTPNEISDEEYAHKVEAVGAVDVLCCHIPPALAELTYDVVSRRFERGSAAVLAAVQKTSPRLVLFGHVHNPLVGRMRVGRTECVNVGHFRATERPYVLRV